MYTPYCVRRLLQRRRHKIAIVKARQAEIETNGVALVMCSDEPAANPFGYAYVGDTRCGFSMQGLWRTRPVQYWPEPTPEQYALVAEVLAYQPWGHLVPAKVTKE